MADPTTTYILRISARGMRASLRAWRERCANLTAGQCYVTALLEDISEDMPNGEQHTEEAEDVEAIRLALGDFITITARPYDGS